MSSSNSTLGPRTEKEALDLAIQFCKANHIPEGCDFWTTTASRNGISTGTNGYSVSFIKGKKFTIAYLLYLAERYGRTAVVLNKFSGQTQPGTNLASLYLSFPAGYLVNNNDVHMGSPLWFHNTTMIEMFPKLKPISSLANKNIGSMTIFEYCFDPVHNSKVPLDLVDQNPTVISIDYLTRTCKDLWFMETGREWVDTDTAGLVFTNAEIPIKAEDIAPKAVEITAENVFPDEYESDGTIKIPTTRDYLVNDGNGKLVIGDLVMLAPPSSISFSNDTQAVALPTVRTASNPVITTGASSSRANISLFISGVDEVNNTLRPLIAMYRNAPFTTVQNTTIFRAFIGKRMDPFGQVELDEDSVFKTPIPVILDSISINTIAGYPNSFQVDLTIALFNDAIYCPSGLKFLRTTDAAIRQSNYLTRRYSKAFNITYLDQSDNEETVGTVSLSDSDGNITTIAPPRISQAEQTVYPAESWPFIKAYKSSLSEVATYPDLLNRPRKWDLYSKSNNNLTITYHSTSKLDLIQYRFESQLESFREIQNILNLMYTMLADPSDDKLRTQYLGASNRVVKVDPAWIHDLKRTFEEYRNVGKLVQIIKSEVQTAKRRLKMAGIDIAKQNNPELDLDTKFLNYKLDGTEELTSFLLEFHKYVQNLNSIVYQSANETKNGAGIKEILDKDGNVIATTYNLFTPEYIKIFYDLSEAIYDGIAAEIEDIVVSEENHVIDRQVIEIVNDSSDKISSYHSQNTYTFKAAVMGISVSYRNNLAQIPVHGFTRPTYQHMGGSNMRVNISIKTNNEELIKILTDIKTSTSTIGQLVNSGEVDLMDMTRIGVNHNLLQSIGLEYFSLASSTIDSISGTEGWFEVHLDFIQNDIKLTDYESLKLIKRPSYGFDILEVFCPIKDIKILNKPIDKTYILGQGHIIDTFTKLSEKTGRPFISIRILNSADGSTDYEKTLAYMDLLSPYLRRSSLILGYLKEFDDQADKSIASVYRQLEALYMGYTKMIIANFSSLLKARYEGLTKFTFMAAPINPPTDITFMDSQDEFSTIQGYALNFARLRDLSVIFSRNGFTNFLNYLIEDKNDVDDEVDIKLLKQLRDLIKDYNRQLDDTIGTTYPDLPIPIYNLDGTTISHKLFGPAFYTYTDIDFEEYRQASKIVSNLHNSITLQLAAIQGQLAKGEYEELNTSLNDYFSTIAQKVKGDLPDFIADENGNLVLDDTFNQFIDFYQAIKNGHELGKRVNFDTQKDLTKYIEDSDEDILILWKDELQIKDKKTGKLIDASPEVTRKMFSKAVSAAILVRYYIFMSVLASALSIEETIVDIDLKTTKDKDGTAHKDVVFYKKGADGKLVEVRRVNPAIAAEAIFSPDYKGALDIIGGVAATSDTNSDKVNGVNKSQEAKLFQIIAQIKQDTELILTQGSSPAYAGLLGISDVDADRKRFELDQKIKAEFISNPRMSLNRGFPTFKLFFVEENAGNLMLFDDFYSYDAVHSIDVVHNKHSASSTAIIKLSNVTNILTGTDVATLYKDGTSVDLPGLYLKPGTPIILRMGYGSDYRQLPIVFQGAITEVVPGSVVEITAQSWGAELNKRLAKEEPIEYSGRKHISTIGGVILDVLDRIPGLNHFGRWEQRGVDISPAAELKTGPEIKRITAISRNPMISWLLGLGTDFTLGSGVSSSVQALLKDRSNDHLFLNIGNSLYDNIYVKGLRTHGYSGTMDVLINPDIIPSDIFYWAYGFNWVVKNSTAWEVLNEICLHLGDYIVTTLPYNEGSNQHTVAPRMTLYIGPRDGNYKAADQSIKYDSIGELLRSRAESIMSTLTDLTLDDNSSKNTIALAQKIYTSQVESTIIPEALKIVGKEYGNLRLRKTLMPLLIDTVGEAGYTSIQSKMMEAWELMDSWIGGLQEKIASNGKDPLTTIWFTFMYLLAGGDGIEAHRLFYTYSNYPYFDSRTISRLNSYSASRKDYGPQLEGFLESKAKYTPTVFQYALKTDLTHSVIPLFIANANRSDANPSLSDIERAIRDELVALGGAAGNVYKPIVEHHFVNSYEDIISNGIIATSDRMFNSVDLWYPSEPGKEPTKVYHAMISYELDPNYIRTYSTAQPNVDPSFIIDWKRSKKAIEYNDSSSLPSFIPIAFQVLANVMRPMYQGNLTIVGNPNIKPHHIVHLYDAVNNMTGPVEVEEVIHSFSPANGFTTTIVPNLLVYNRNMGAYVDQLSLNVLNELRVMRTAYKVLGSAVGGTMIYGASKAGYNTALGLLEKGTAKFMKKATKAVSKKVATYGNIAGWIYLAYQALSAMYKGIKTWGSQTIGIAGIAAGHNPLIFVPLLYNGRPYIAGMDGIGTFNRSLYTVMMGNVEDSKGSDLTSIYPIITPILFNDPDTDK